MRYWAKNVCSGPDVGVVLRFACPDVSGIARPGLLYLIIAPETGAEGGGGQKRNSISQEAC